MGVETFVTVVVNISFKITAKREQRRMKPWHLAGKGAQMVK